MHSFFLSKISQIKEFDDVLDRELAFLDNKNIDLKKSQNLQFSKGRFTGYDLLARSVGPTVSERKSHVYFNTRFTADSWKRKSARFRKSVAVQQIFV